MTGRVDIEEGVVFGTAGSRPLRADVFRPTESADERLPGVVFVHGGGWRTGDRSQLRGYGVLVGRHGYVGMASEYRLIPEATYPENLHDVKAAIRWMRANADELGVDPNRIAVHGNSAGGHLALLAAATGDRPDLEGEGGNPEVSSAVQACIAIYAPTLFAGTGWDDGARPEVALFENGHTPELLEAASPLLQVHPDFPPTFLVHGTGDELVPPKASLLMYDALIAAGVSTELKMVADQPHAFDAQPGFGRQVANEIVHFLDRHL
jgi:acetyl esterase/lipase